MSLPQGVTSQRVQTSRLDTHYLRSGADDGVPVVFVHGNVSSGRFYAELMASLPDTVLALAPDLRGFGDSEPAPIDATRGVKDFADDVRAFMTALGIGTADRPAHLVGWSVGGGVVMQVAATDPTGIASLLLEAPMSPYGFGGTKDAAGTPCFADWAGTGGGTANPDFVKRLGDKDTSADADTSPRSIMNTYYVKPPFSFPAELEDDYVASMVAISVGEDHYPGDLTSSENWPTVAPGTKGINNAISGKWCDVSAFSSIDPKPPVVWIRGADDQIVSDTSLFDFGFLGQIGAVPGWPGEDVSPAQPMIGQTRAVLDAYRAGGGQVDEVVLADCGHSPHLEHPQTFQARLLALL